jgi:hypothetical protein
VYDLNTGYNTKQCLKQWFQMPVNHEISISSKTEQRKVLTCSTNIHCVVVKLTQPVFNNVLMTETEYNSGESQKIYSCY